MVAKATAEKMSAELAELEARQRKKGTAGWTRTRETVTAGAELHMAVKQASDREWARKGCYPQNFLLQH